MPPDPGGVSAYSRDLVSHLAREFEIILVRDAAAEALPDSLRDFPRVRPGKFHPEDFGQPLCVYNMGNNTEQCAVTYDWMRRHPGLTILHDLNIHGFLLDHFVRQAKRSGFAYSREKRRSVEEHPYYCALREAHGEEGAREARAVLLDGALPDIPRLPANRLVTSSSLAVVSHSRWACEQLRANGDPASIHYMPLGIEYPIVVNSRSAARMRGKIGIGENELVCVCGGYLEPSRRVEALVHAAAQLQARGVRIRIVLAGAIGASYRSYLTGLAGSLKVGGQLSFCGFMENDHDFIAALSLADVVVHLRHPTNGESSATVLRSLALGKPVLVSDIDSYHELPDDCCWKVDSDAKEVPLLAEYLSVLAKRPEVAAVMGRAAQRYIEQYHVWPRVAEEFSAIARETLRQRDEVFIDS